MCFSFQEVSRRLQNANGALSRSANQMRVFLALGQSGVSNFALVGKKIKKKCPLSQPISYPEIAQWQKEASS